MKITIKRFSDEILLEGEAESFKDFVEKNRAYLSGADLSEADLSEANLYKANLSGAYLSEANLYKANLSEANLYKANLSGAYLSEAKIKISQKDDLLKALKIKIIK